MYAVFMVGVALRRVYSTGEGARPVTLSKRITLGWAAEIGCTSWAQPRPKFVPSQPALKRAIPGRRRAARMADNAQAGTGTVAPPTFWRGKLQPLLG